MTEIPREKSFYWPSDHAVQRSKDRGIEWEYVAETLSKGQIKQCHKDGCRLFVNDYMELDQPIGVIASIKTGKILTVEWRYVHND